jgi:bifunctional non-homologous end joining protein LigD
MGRAMVDTLEKYKAKRNFNITPEPSSPGQRSVGAGAFVIQKHWATRLHYDFRIELNGAMKSWAVPKGPSLDPADKRMAVHVEDHPISYNAFEGQIPAGQYGAGKVIIWDKGTWEPIGDAAKGYEAGHLKFALHGHKLNGTWALVRMKPRGEKQEAWLLIKEKDEYAHPAAEFSVVDEMPDSVAQAGTQDAQPSKPAKKTTARTTKAAALKKTPASAASAKKSTDGLPAGAQKSALPDTLAPELATLVDAPPGDASDWEYEIKFDGYRLLTRIAPRSLQIFTRNGNDWTGKMPALADALKKLKLPSGWYDGEAVALNDHGVPDFQRLQQAFDGSHTQELVYYLFDVPYCRGYDLRAVPLNERRALLRILLEDSANDSDKVRFSETLDGDPAAMLASACQMGLEGVIGKRRDAPYVLRRSPDWIKLKCTQRQEFVIGGYTEPQGERTAIGSLLLGVHDTDGHLRYAGNVGTGFHQRALTDLHKKLASLATEKSPFSGPTGRYRNVHWVKPSLLAEVSFAQWTADGRIRHSVFQGLRSDKKARAITRDQPVHVNTPATKSKPPPPALDTPLKSIKITHPDRIVDAASGITKIELIRYYSLVAPLMMPHLKGRPVSLVRAPDGVGGELFFQKHLERVEMDGVRQLSPELDPGHAPLLEIVEPKGLMSAAQMNVLEFHVWNGMKNTLMKPDRFTFDLDPGEKTEWPAMQQAALLVRAFLQQLELESLIKTSGGKGLHVVVPIRKQYGWDAIKDFSRAIVVHLAKNLPDRFAAKSGPRNRVGKIFIDYLRNGFGATTVCAWSVRSRPGLGVSVPIAWEEVEKLSNSAQWNVANIHTRLDQGNAPWADAPFENQSVSPAMKILGFTPQAGSK